MISDRFTRTFLRLEGLGLALLCLWLYAGSHQSWWIFAVLILAPDLSMLGYLAVPRIGALAYNVVHTWLAPLLLFVLGWWGGLPFGLPLAFILGAHIGLDRALGFGLKLPTSFNHTHLGPTGRRGTGSG